MMTVRRYCNKTSILGQPALHPATVDLKGKAYVYVVFGSLLCSHVCVLIHDRKMTWVLDICLAGCWDKMQPSSWWTTSTETPAPFSSTAPVLMLDPSSSGLKIKITWDASRSCKNTSRRFAKIAILLLLFSAYYEHRTWLWFCRCVP